MALALLHKSYTMKARILVITIIICCISFTANAQMKLIVNGLINVNQTAQMNINTIDYKPIKEKSTAQKNNGTVTMVYRVERNMDNKSAKIENACKTGRVFQKTEVWVRNSSGGTDKYQLSNCYFLNYAAHYKNAKSPTESFTVVYNTKKKI